MKASVHIINIFMLFTLLLWPLALFGSVFLFDHPKSSSNIGVWLVAFSIWLYPLPVLFGSYRAWKSRDGVDENRIKKTIIGTVAPLSLCISILVMQLTWKH